MFGGSAIIGLYDPYYYSSELKDRKYYLKYNNIIKNTTATFLQPLIARRDYLNTQGEKLSGDFWQQQGGQSGLGDPLSLIAQLIDVLQDIHIAGALLVRSDPLFIECWGRLVIAIVKTTQYRKKK